MKKSESFLQIVEEIDAKAIKHVTLDMQQTEIVITFVGEPAQVIDAAFILIKRHKN